MAAWVRPYLANLIPTLTGQSKLDTISSHKMYIPSTPLSGRRPRATSGWVISLPVLQIHIIMADSHSSEFMSLIGNSLNYFCIPQRRPILGRQASVRSCRWQICYDEVSRFCPLPLRTIYITRAPGHADDSDTHHQDYFPSQILQLRPWQCTTN